MTPPIRLMVADVDGTLVTHDKVLTDRAVGAVRALHAADILFAITSGRPPRGMSMLIEPLQLGTPIAAFKRRPFVNPGLSVIEQHTIPSPVVTPAIALLESSDWTSGCTAAPAGSSATRTGRTWTAKRGPYSSHRRW
ncbi:HAD family hydrolase [Planosporangium thailandense]|uniref:HAD family hydrolase n=1 Tax=Planosporangium thailandense TaxID=765197 RepID=UPI00197BD583|nr:HAD hydrolase family protein [Planosporangium thailandense]